MSHETAGGKGAAIVQDVDGVTLVENEEVLHDFRPSWAKWCKRLTIAILLALPTVGISLLLLYGPYRARKRTRYVITSDRIIIKQGTWKSSSTQEYTFDRIRQIKTGQGFIEKFISHGNIEVLFHGGDDLKFAGVQNYDQVANTIRQQQHQQNQG